MAVNVERIVLTQVEIQCEAKKNKNIILFIK